MMGWKPKKEKKSSTTAELLGIVSVFSFEQISFYRLLMHQKKLILESFPCCHRTEPAHSAANDKFRLLFFAKIVFLPSVSYLGCWRWWTATHKIGLENAPLLKHITQNTDKLHYCLLSTIRTENHVQFWCFEKKKRLFWNALNLRSVFFDFFASKCSVFLFSYSGGVWWLKNGF